MNCSVCGNPLRVLSGGNKTTEGTTDITMVHIWGCMNEKCKNKMIEQSRSENIQESFKG
jgi:hypothetical protein